MGGKANQENERLLAVAYYARVTAGVGTIFSNIAGVSVSSTTAALWLSRINIYIAVVTGASTYAIGKLQGDAWVSWLLAQPFRIALVKDADKNAFLGKAEDAINAVTPVVKNALGTYGTAAAGESGVSTPAPKPSTPNIYAVPESQVLKTNTKTPFRNEAEMMSKLADVLSEMK